MAREILDDPREDSKVTHTQTAFRHAKIAWGLMLFFFLVVAITTALGDRARLNPIPNVLMIIAFLASATFAVAGFFKSLKSFIRKEPSSFKKYIALVGNLIIVLFLLSAIGANFLDFMQ